MNLPEFKALKAEVVARAKRAICSYGVKTSEGGVVVGWNEVDIYQMDNDFGIFEIFRVLTPGGNRPIYSERFGKEVSLGWTHLELVSHYKWCLKIMESRMVLDDIANP